jgi:hypothetical protein
MVYVLGKKVEAIANISSTRIMRFLPNWIALEELFKRTCSLMMDLSLGERPTLAMLAPASISFNTPMI